MTHEHLDKLVKVGSLKVEDATTREISGLIHSGTARLADAKKENLSPELRFDLVYNSAHALSLAALRMAGYRSGNRYLVFQCLQHTLNFPSDQWRVLDQAHRKRRELYSYLQCYPQVAIFSKKGVDMTFTISYLDRVRNVSSVPASGIGAAARREAFSLETSLTRERIYAVNNG